MESSSLGTSAMAPVSLADEAMSIPRSVKLIAGAVLAVALLAMTFVGVSRVSGPGIGSGGGSSGPFAVLGSDRASGWSYAGCRLDSSVFLPRGDYRLSFNAIGTMEPEETPAALKASAAFLSCAVSTAIETCDGNARDRLAADMVTFFARHGRAMHLVLRMTKPGARDGTHGGAIRSMPGLAGYQKEFQAEAEEVLDAADSRVGYSVQSMVEKGFVRPAQFGWWSRPEPIERHLKGIAPKASACG